jgi:hypothetical protein
MRRVIPLFAVGFGLLVAATALPAQDDKARPQDDVVAVPAGDATGIDLAKPVKAVAFQFGYVTQSGSFDLASGGMFQYLTGAYMSVYKGQGYHEDDNYFYAFEVGYPKFRWAFGKKPLADGRYPIWRTIGNDTWVRFLDGLRGKR